jgi:hypothetical protein
MRVLLDEDVPVQVLEPLKRVLKSHHVQHLNELRWKNKKDLFVLRDASSGGFQVIVTNDAAQLDDVYETEAIKKSGLHHVRYGQRPDLGLHGLALALGAIVSAMPPLIAELEAATGHRLVRIHALDPKRRYDLTDPRKSPPKYWPR